MKNSDTILEIAELLPDYLGFIFWKKSARFFDGVLPEIPKSILKVGVFVDATYDEIMATSSTYELDVLQLHGNESPEFCKQLMSSTCKIIKAFSVHEAFDFAVLKQYESVCDYFLFDTKGLLPGGNGNSFNWRLLEKQSVTKPYFLSGGIGLSSVAPLREFLQSEVAQQCIAVDVNSQFETAPGIKNKRELIEFKKKLYEN